MGHIAHLKDLNVLCNYLSLEKDQILITQGCFDPRLVEISTGSGEANFKFPQCIFAIS